MIFRIIKHFFSYDEFDEQSIFLWCPIFGFIMALWTPLMLCTAWFSDEIYMKVNGILGIILVDCPMLYSLYLMDRKHSHIIAKSVTAQKKRIKTSGNLFHRVVWFVSGAWIQAVVEKHKQEQQDENGDNFG
jgi:hypothetical protein